MYNNCSSGEEWIGSRRGEEEKEDSKWPSVIGMVAVVVQD